MKFLKRFLILLVLCVPFVAKADMGAPVIREFEIVVVNPEGVSYTPNSYNSAATGTLKKDDVVIVKLETAKGYEIGDKDGNTLGTITTLDGFSIVQDEVDPTKLTDDVAIKKLDKKQTAIVYNENGAVLYKGPSKVYDKVGTIKKGTELEYEYAVGSAGFTHIYVNYNGKKGWVEILNKNVLIENSTQYIFRVDVKTECGTIPKNTIMTPKYKSDMWSRAALFDYNGCKSLLNVFKSEDIMGLYKQKATSKVEIPVYDDSNKTTLLTTIPAGAEFTHYTGSDSQMGTIDIHYVGYDGKTGWTDVTYDAFEMDFEAKPEDSDLKDTVETKKEEIKPNKEENKDNKNNKNNKILNIDSKDLVVICVAGGVVLSLTAIVIIVLVNKSKKKKVKVATEQESINNDEASSEISDDNNTNNEE